MKKIIYTYDNGIFTNLKLVITIARKDGFIKALSKTFKNIYYKLIGVDFSFQSLDKLEIQSPNHSHATMCGSSTQSTVAHIFDMLVTWDKSILDGVFVDYGSGKGKLIIHAKKYGFKKVIGIEFAKELYQTSILNIQKLHLKNIQVLHMDAINYIPQPNTRVIYFHNPFSSEVFDIILPKLIDETKKFKKTIYLVYRVPLQKEVFKKYPAIEHIKSDMFQKDATEFYKLKENNERDTRKDL